MNVKLESEELFNSFRESGVPLTFGKKMYAELVGQSVSTVSGNICKGTGVATYSKLGKSKNSQVLFMLKDVCNFITSQKVQVA